MLTQVDVRVYWDSIEPGLREIRKQAKPEWRPEDIYSALLNGIAELYVDIEQSPCESFIIMQERPNAFQPCKSLLIWVAYDKRGKAADQYMDYIEQMAREKGCNKIEFWTPWLSLAESLTMKGYKITNYITEKEII
jgi:hypothetical protein|tara:strand:- start:2030 stop:2437 length:408 start_codon:yes stop_codon:yes gene_type:complete